MTQTPELWTPSEADLDAVAADPALYARYMALIAAETAAEQSAYREPLPDSPGALAARLTGGKEMHRPHLDLIDQVFMRCVNEGRQRVIINMPARSGKTRRARWGGLYVETHRPQWNLMHVSYGATLAQESSSWIRNQLESYDLGVRPRRDSRASDRWVLEGYEGGMIAVGLGGSLTGRGGNVVWIDDLIKNASEAESPTYREANWKFWRETLYPRLEPDASVIWIGTRWHRDDVFGRLLREEPGVWTVIRVPSLGEPGDALGRAEGEPLWPERYPLADVLTAQRIMGPYAFNAQHQQRPGMRSGGVWSEQTIVDYRVTPDACPELVVRGVAVDPSASEDDGGDEAGIIVGGRSSTGEAYIVADLSGQYDPDDWGRIALLAAMEYDCDVIYEQNLTPVFIRRVFKSAWARLKRDVDDETSNLSEEQRRWVRRTRLMPALIPVRAAVAKILRAEPVAQVYRQGRVHHVGHFFALEEQMTDWRPGDKDSPDRLDALVHLVTWLGDAPPPGESHPPTGGRIPSVLSTGRGQLTGSKIALGRRGS